LDGSVEGDVSIHPDPLVSSCPVVREKRKQVPFPLVSSVRWGQKVYHRSSHAVVFFSGIAGLPVYIPKASEEAVYIKYWFTSHYG
jgi:hypothetical protein